LQKYIDQGISVNTSYNPEFFEDSKVPMSRLITDMITFYKFGGKQMYYNNTFDGAGEWNDSPEIKDLPTEMVDDEDCESCKI
jgi:ribonucleoside-diphosphate reductase alpha chain